jgi:hypothetical protein
MLRTLLLGLVMLVAASPARAAGDVETCRNSTAEAAARLAACEATNRTQQPFTYGSLPGREDFYFVAGSRPRRHCRRQTRSVAQGSVSDEAIQTASAVRFWIASLRSQ